MLKRQIYVQKIFERLSYISNIVQVSNSVNFTDVNIYAENFYRDFLNMLYKYNLININILEQNCTAIDLGDCENKIAFQVTSTSDFTKTQKTVSAFIKKKLYRDYDRLIILNICKKANHRQELIGNRSTYQLNTIKDIWDIKILARDINDLSTDRLKELCVFIEKEVNFINDDFMAKEVRTFISLIEYLTDESQPSAGNGYLEEPDPENKIYKRFAEYSSFLEAEYLDLYTEYGQVLRDVLLQSDIGQVRIRRLGLFLKASSDRILNECFGDAKKALTFLVERYSNILSKNNIEYDESAIKFFLVDQLIRCNVFPNK